MIEKNIIFELKHNFMLKVTFCTLTNKKIRLQSAHLFSFSLVGDSSSRRFYDNGTRMCLTD